MRARAATVRAALFLSCAAGILTVRAQSAAEAPAGPVRETLFQAVPEDAVLGMRFPGPAPGTEAGSFLATANLITQLAGEGGLLDGVDPGVRLWIDLVASLPLLAAKPCTVALVDVEARPRGEFSHRLSKLQAGIVLHGGDHDALRRRIQTLLSRHTNTDETRLERGTYRDREFYTLRDRRLEVWASISWGQVGDDYVIGIGDGAFEKVADAVDGRAARLADAPWMRESLAAVKADPSQTCFFVDLASFLTDADDLLRRKVERFTGTVGLAGYDRAVCAVRREGRSVEITATGIRGTARTTRKLASEQFRAALPPGGLPDAAGAFAVIDADAGLLFHSLGAAYLAVRSPEGRESWTAYWSALEARSGVQVEKDILAALGRGIVIHNYPAHALRIPVALTIAVPIVGDRNRLRDNLGRIFEVLREELNDGGMVHLERAVDGIWYIHAGIQGPALGISGDWLYISYSPQAVRANFLPAGAPRDGTSPETEKPAPTNANRPE